MDYVLGGGGIETALDRARTDYRHYGLSATTLLSGQIPGQYTQAKRVNPKIQTVIMTGGGRDDVDAAARSTCTSGRALASCARGSLLASKQLDRRRPSRARTRA